jgi:hypothetical protein
MRNESGKQVAGESAAGLARRLPDVRRAALRRDYLAI